MAMTMVENAFCDLFANSARMPAARHPLQVLPSHPQFPIAPSPAKDVAFETSRSSS